MYRQHSKSDVSGFDVEMPIAAEDEIGCGRASLTSKTIHAAIVHPVYGKRRSRAGQQRMRETPLRLMDFALRTQRNDAHPSVR